jgi:hypothetical protein
MNIMRELKRNPVYLPFPESVRWQPHGRHAALFDRWTGWAESLRQRLERVASRHHRLSLILAWTQAFGYSQVQHWQQTVFACYPKINLAIGPILLNWIRRTTSPFVRPGQMNLVSLAFSATERGTADGQPSAGERTMDLRTFAATGIPHDSAKAGRESLGSSLQTPLMRVFARTVAAGWDFGSYRQRYETLSVQRSLQLVKQRVDERRRIEEFVRQPVFMLPQRQAFKTLTNTIHEEVFQSPHGSKAGIAGMTGSAPLLPIDIDQLTDRVVRNIDGRIVAHRERTGRVF